MLVTETEHKDLKFQVFLGRPGAEAHFPATFFVAKYEQKLES